MNRLPQSRRTRIGIGLLVLIGASVVCCNSLPKTSDEPSAPTSAPQPLLQEATVAPVVDTAVPVATDTDVPTEEPTVAPTDTEVPVPTDTPVSAPTQAPAAQPTEPPPPPGQASGCINFNTASFDDLRRITEINDDIAQQIIDLRAERPFSGWDDLVRRVKGIGENNVKQIQAEGLGCF